MDCGGELVLVTGARGFVGSNLVRILLGRGFRVRCLIRGSSDDALARAKGMEVFRGDLLNPGTLKGVFEDVTAAYYLVHSMKSAERLAPNLYMVQDRTAACNFARAAKDAGVERAIYLSGLYSEKRQMPYHLASRLETGRILQYNIPKTTILKSPIIIGKGGVAFEMLRQLVERLPVIFFPRWTDAKTAPIALNDVLNYLVGCLVDRRTCGRVFDIAGPSSLSYMDVMVEIARARGLRRRFVSVPFLPLRFCARIADICTDVPPGYVHPLLECLKYDGLRTENSIRELMPFELTSIGDAVRAAIR